MMRPPQLDSSWGGTGKGLISMVGCFWHSEQMVLACLARLGWLVERTLHCLTKQVEDFFSTREKAENGCTSGRALIDSASVERIFTDRCVVIKTMQPIREETDS